MFLCYNCRLLLTIEDRRDVKREKNSSVIIYFDDMINAPSLSNLSAEYFDEWLSVQLWTSTKYSNYNKLRILSHITNAQGIELSQLKTQSMGIDITNITYQWSINNQTVKSGDSSSDEFTPFLIVEQFGLESYFADTNSTHVEICFIIGVATNDSDNYFGFDCIAIGSPNNEFLIDIPKSDAEYLEFEVIVNKSANNDMQWLNYYDVSIILTNINASLVNEVLFYQVWYTIANTNTNTNTDANNLYLYPLSDITSSPTLNEIILPSSNVTIFGLIFNQFGSIITTTNTVTLAINTNRNRNTQEMNDLSIENHQSCSDIFVHNMLQYHISASNAQSVLLSIMENYPECITSDNATIILNDIIAIIHANYLKAAHSSIILDDSDDDDDEIEYNVNTWCTINVADNKTSESDFDFFDQITLVTLLSTIFDVILDVGVDVASEAFVMRDELLDLTQLVLNPCNYSVDDLVLEDINSNSDKYSNDNIKLVKNYFSTNYLNPHLIFQGNVIYPIWKVFYDADIDNDNNNSYSLVIDQYFRMIDSLIGVYVENRDSINVDIICHCQLWLLGLQIKWLTLNIPNENETIWESNDDHWAVLSQRVAAGNGL